MYKRISIVATCYQDINYLDRILLSHEYFDHVDMKLLSEFKNKCPIYAPKWSLKPTLFNSKSLCKGDEFVVGDLLILKYL